MSGSTFQYDSRARSKTARLLALFFALSVMLEGLFFSQEWLFFGFVFMGYMSLFCLRGKFNLESLTAEGFGWTDCLLLGMLIFSMFGFINPIRVKDGVIEVLRWGIYWLVYRLGIQISSDKAAKEFLKMCMQWIATIVAIFGWLPWIGDAGGRISSVLGYPNTTAAFLGAIILLSSRRKYVQIFLGISLLGTGSRAGVGLFLVVFLIQRLFLWLRLGHFPKLKYKPMECIGMIIFGVVASILVLRINKEAWDNLMAWGFSSSSWQERFVYFKDGVHLAINSWGIPKAGGWFAFPTIQHFPYWTADPHSSIIYILLNQGVLGLISMGIWCGFTLSKVLGTWKINRRASYLSTDTEELKAEVEIWSALVFLGLHSLMDADSSFGALGFLFWMIFGISSLSRARYFFSKQQLQIAAIGRSGMLMLSLSLCLVSGALLINQNLLEKEKIWNEQALKIINQDPNKSLSLWDTSLKWDTTQIEVRQLSAEALLKSGNIVDGLQALEEYLKWQSFEITAYEWAQSVAWDTAEIERLSNKPASATLYLWVEKIPQRIEEKSATLSSSERMLWKEYIKFKPTPHILLLSEFSRKRQLTLLPL